MPTSEIQIQNSLMYPFSVFPQRSLIEDIFFKPWRMGTKIDLKDVNDRFEVILDVHQFKPDEVKVKIIDNKYVMVEGKHEEKKDEHGFISRKFTRKYALPKDCEITKVESRITGDGFLIITVPKLQKTETTRVIPVTYEKSAKNLKAKL